MSSSSEVSDHGGLIRWLSLPAIYMAPLLPCFLFIHLAPSFTAYYLFSVYSLSLLVTYFHFSLFFFLVFVLFWFIFATKEQECFLAWDPPDNFNKPHWKFFFELKPECAWWKKKLKKKEVLVSLLLLLLHKRKRSFPVQLE